MKIFTKEEWERKQYKGRWDDSRFNLDRVAAGELHPYYIGRRHLMVGGERGPELLTEGLHFLVDGDYSELPVLEKANAKVGACYQFAGGYIQVTEIIRYTEEEANERGLYYLDHVRYVQHTRRGTYNGGCALPGGDVVRYFVFDGKEINR